MQTKRGEKKIQYNTDYSSNLSLLVRYPEDDPVVAFIKEKYHGELDITGEKWNAEHDTEYLEAAMDGAG